MPSRREGDCGWVRGGFWVGEGGIVGGCGGGAGGFRSVEVGIVGGCGGARLAGSALRV